jgi:hypothetical protein
MVFGLWFTLCSSYGSFSDLLGRLAHGGRCIAPMLVSYVEAIPLRRVHSPTSGKPSQISLSVARLR